MKNNSTNKPTNLHMKNVLHRHPQTRVVPSIILGGKFSTCYTKESRKARLVFKITAVKELGRSYLSCKEWLYEQNKNSMENYGFKNSENRESFVSGIIYCNCIF